MILQIFNRDDETTLLPSELRRGDVFAVHDDAYVPGGIERKTNFFIKVPDPPKLNEFTETLVRSRYGVPATPNDEAPVILAREWKLEYWLFLDPDQVAIVDAVDVLPDGPVEGGGTVTEGVLDGRFTVSDLKYK